jgi:glycosyltransferase involved in cell wall biosynthesis
MPISCRAGRLLPHVADFHLVINALSASFGGGSVVVREFARHLALARPHWTLTLLVTPGKPAHDQLRSDLAEARVAFHDAPASTGRLTARWMWENRSLGKILGSIGATVLLQPNGMVPRGIDVPVHAHIGDPWPYLDVRDRWFDPAIAVLRRRGHGRATRVAHSMGFTSRYVMELVRDAFGALPERSGVYYNGLPSSWLGRTGIVPISRRSPTIVTVSLVSPYKQQEAIVRVLPEVIRRTRLGDLRYRIIGPCDDRYYAELSEVITGLGLQERVTIEGRVDQSVVERAFATSRCFALPSLSESFGLPSIEAMSFGTPVVVARAGATPEVCGDAAEFCEPEDDPSLADALVRVLTDDDRAAELQQRGLANAKRFDWRDSSEALACTLETIRP